MVQDIAWKGAGVAFRNKVSFTSLEPDPIEAWYCQINLWLIMKIIDG